MSDIAVDLDRLRQHAAFVDSLVGDVDAAVSALSGGDLLPEAFGTLCAFLVSPSLAMSAAATGLLGEDGALLTRTATELRGAAAQWEQFEDDVVTTVRGLERGMGA